MNTLNGGLSTDAAELYRKEGTYFHARNAFPGSHTGDKGYLGNEPANLQCITLPYELIGAIPSEGNKWVLFTTDNTNSEIGLFTPDTCTYTKIVNDPCLGFKQTNLIWGASRRTYDCSINVYWADALNPDRVMDINDPPYITNMVLQGDCYIEVKTSVLDCDKLRLSPLLTIPCLTLEVGSGSGTLPNGQYQVAVAYMIKGVRVSDYVALSNSVSVWTHDNLSNSIKLSVDGADTDFEEFELVLISLINGQTVAKRVGIYPTRLDNLLIDTVTVDNPIIDLSIIPYRTPPVEKSDAIFQVNEYIVRSGIYNKEELNYQPLANKIKCKWLSASFPAAYHSDGGKFVGYCPDEQYAFFIRWVYNTGDKTASYHIPGRAPNSTDFDLITGPDAEYEQFFGITPYRWRVYNTATFTNFLNFGAGDGGTFIGEGQMGYWESEERYPNNMPDVWGDLCGKPIRHHKFPDSTTSDICVPHNIGGTQIRSLCAQFYDIPQPVDSQGNIVQSIVGFEILRGSREGNKTVIAFGQLNNMRGYKDPLNNTAGWYQNFPYNDRGSDFYHTSNYGAIYEETTFGKNERKFDNTSQPLQEVSDSVFSFHSPDTNFSKPYLNASKIKLYHTMKGLSTGIFEEPWKHPKNKQMTNFFATLVDILTIIQLLNQTAAAPFLDIHIGADSDSPISSGFANRFTDFSAGGDLSGQAAYIQNQIQLGVVATNNLIALTYLAVTGVYGRQISKIFMAFIPAKQYALQYNSHCFYHEYIGLGPNNQSRRIISNQYIKEGLSQFAGRTMNNVMRGGFVGIESARPFAYTDTQWGGSSVDYYDFSRPMVTQAPFGVKKKFNYRSGDLRPLQAVSYYAGIKNPTASQYGQLESIKQIPVGCVNDRQPTGVSFTGGIWGGDHYITRYTEKNPFPLFNNWMVDEQDETEFDYRQGYQIPFPRYWTWTLKNQNDLINQPSMYRHLTRVAYTGNPNGGPPSFGFPPLFPPPPFSSLGETFIEEGWFYMKDAYFYLHVNGVRDFFVGAEVNVGYRDWDEDPALRHYDPARYTSLQELFRTDRMKDVLNKYRYDYSLSTSKMYNQYISWAQMLPRNFDVDKIYCNTYYPKRLAASLPQSEELKRDNWRWFLPNNYKDMPSIVTMIKAFRSSGALILFKDESPAFLQGTATLNTTGLDLTIGSNGLFAQPLQYISNVDKPYGYGSCQNRLAVVSTPHGIAWASQKQGKVMLYSGQLQELNDHGLDNWLANYLPSQTLKANPVYPFPDNLLIGVGVAMTYDATHEILYITKRDYAPFRPAVQVLPEIHSSVPPPATKLADISWTWSFDMAQKQWISPHDWHPYWLLPTHDHFISVLSKKLWKHNSRWDLYCNYYGTDYPFEVGIPIDTGADVAVLRSVEYQLECYRYKANNQDRFHVLDFNFDKAWIDNSEQHSGLLNLNLKSKINPVADLQYPLITLNSMSILYSKEEQKYRFNQFWDVTNDRGEFSGSQTQAYDTQGNGYILDLNPLYFDYNKPAFQRKKIRHYASRLFLKRQVSGSTKMLLKLTNPKQVQSLR